MADSAWRSKLRRARHHERDLEAALRQYSQLNPFELISKLEGNDLVVRVHIRHKVPEELSLIVGDLLHNARSALDLLVTSAAWDFASESGSQLTPADERKLFFPVTRTESDFDRAAKKIEPYLSGETMTPSGSCNHGPSLRRGSRKRTTMLLLTSWTCSPGWSQYGGCNFSIISTTGSDQIRVIAPSGLVSGHMAED
jgi:hypothetical protein